MYPSIIHVNFNFNFIMSKVNTDYIRQTQVLNIDSLRLKLYPTNMAFLE